MIKKGFKIAAVVSMAVCLTAGIFLFNNSFSKADGESTDVTICDFTFEDGDTHAGDFMNNKVDLQIDDSKNSTAGSEYDETVEGSSCIRVDRSKVTDGWWQWNTLRYDLKQLTAGVTYKISMDVYHENDAVAKGTNGAKNDYTDMRAIKMGTYYAIPDSVDTQYANDDTAKQAEADAINEPIDERNREREERNANLKPGETPEPYEAREIYKSPHTRKYGQIGSLKGVSKGEWERLEGYITIKEDVFERSEAYYLYLFYAYPEPGDQNRGDTSYSDNSVTREVFYIDNFRVIDVSTNAAPATPTPEPTAVPFPASPEPTAPAQQQAVVEDPVVVPDNGPSLEKGYEEAVAGITYRVIKDNGDEVTVVGFDDPKSSIKIPDTVKIDDYAYKVVKIEAKAFKDETDVKSLTIGANVREIGKNAFNNCSSLKKITIKSSVLKKIGSGAFKKAYQKATVKVPKKKKAAYKKMLKKAGLKKAKVK